MTGLGRIFTFNHLNKPATHLGCHSCHRVVVVVVVLTSVLSAVPVADIKAVITGKDCPHMKEKGALKQNKVRVFVCTRVCTRAYVWVGGCVTRREDVFRMREGCIT